MLSVLRHRNKPTDSYGRTVVEFLEHFNYNTLTEDEIQFILGRVNFTGGRLYSANVLVTLINKIDTTDNARDVRPLLWKLFVAVECNQRTHTFSHLQGDEYEIALSKWFLRIRNGEVNAGVTELDNDIFVAHVTGCFNCFSWFFS